MPRKNPGHLETVLGAVQGAFGTGAAVLLSGGVSSAVTEVIPTGISALDNHVIGVGGLPVGRIVEVFSPPSAGKTALALTASGYCQKEGGGVVWGDLEFALDPDRAVALGVQPDKMVVLQAEFGEEYFDQSLAAIEALSEAKKRPPYLYVTDSIDALVTRDEIEKDLSDSEGVGNRAKLMSRFCRRLVPVLSKQRVCGLFVNQIRSKIGVKFGKKTTTSGGNALAFYASIRLELTPLKALPNGAGRDVRIRAIKNKLRPPFREVTARFLYESGWDDVWTTVNFAKDLGLLKKNAKPNDETYAEAKGKLDECGWKGTKVPKADDEDGIKFTSWDKKKRKVVEADDESEEDGDGEG